MRLIWLIGIIALVLGAGVAGDRVFQRYWAQRHPGGGDGSPPSSSVMPGNDLVDALGLTPAQQNQVRRIWDDVQRKVVENSQIAAQKIQMEREDGLGRLLTPQQKAQYDKLNVALNDEERQIKAKRDADFRRGVEQTLEVLSEPQRRMYEQMLKERTGIDWTAQGAGSPGPAMTPPSGK
jgi:hypothetical protein